MNKKHSGEESAHRLALDRLLLLEEFKRQSDDVNKLLEDYDLHGVATEAEKAEFWERFAVEGAELVHAFSGISRLQGGGGRERILSFLQRHIGVVVDGIVLYAVSGVSEYGRRTRELREMGWKISTQENDPLLKPGQYRLDSLEKDPQVVEKYEAKTRRKKRGNKPPDEPELRLI